MRHASLMLWVLASLTIALQPALGGTWYVPMVEQVPGGFDHIQILMAYPYEFDTPAMSAFCGPSPVGELWSQTFQNNYPGFAAADGPSPGDEAIHFTIWIGGDREIDRPAFHYQAYRGQTRVDNADLICFGPGELDWMVAPGTWAQNSPIPPLVPGDADMDGDVDDADLGRLLNGWGQSGMEWGHGDFTGEGDVGDLDLSQLLNNWGWGVPLEGVPEPASAIMLMVGLPWIVRWRPAKRLRR